MRRDLRDQSLAAPSPRRPVGLAAAALLLLVGAQSAGQAARPSGAKPVPPPAENRINRPQTAQRVVKAFDFEDALAQTHPLPQFWFRAQSTDADARPGFPNWNRAALDFAPAQSGMVSLLLPTKGGSTSVRLEPGVIPVFPDTDYVVSAQVRTRGLNHARAALSARFLDSANKPIAGSEVRGPLVAGGGDAWREVAVPLIGRHPGAAFIQIDLELLQPEQFEPARLPAAHQVWPEDVSGAAWFDDVTVVQLPRVALTTGAPCNIVLAPDKPGLTVQIRDLTGEVLTASLIVQDVDARTLDAQERRVDTGQLRWTWTPRIDRFGWFRATLELSRGGMRVGATHTDFLWLPPVSNAPRTAASPDHSRFGLIFDTLPPDHRGSLPELVRRVNAGAVTIPVWRPGLTAAGTPAEAKALSDAIEPLLASGRRVTAALPIVPDELAAAARVSNGDLWQTLSREDSLWGPYLFPFLDKYGQRVPRWQVGRLSDAVAESPTDPAEPASRLERSIARIVPGPIVGAPWITDAAFPSPDGAGRTSSALVATLPCWTSEDSLGTLADAWREAIGASEAGPELTLVPEALARPAFDERAACAHLMRRTVLAWLAFVPPDAPRGGADLALFQPWEWSEEPRSQIMPRPELGVWRTLADELSDRRIVGELSAGPGVRCFILAPAPGANPGRAGALVAWRESGDPRSAALDVYMGRGEVRAVDLFGNARPVPLTPDPAGGKNAGPGTHRVRVGDSPVFIEGVDVDLARFIASFRIDPDFASAAVSEHEHALVFSNTWPVAIEGRFSIVEPGGLSKDPSKRDRTWKITPRIATFAVPAGGTARIPITVAFGASEEAGMKDFVVDVELTGSASDARLRLRTPLEIRLENVQLDASARAAPTPAGPDVIVEAVVTNRGKLPANLQLAAFAPGESRRRATVTDLAPSTSTTVRFSFAGAAARLVGKNVIVRVEDIDNSAGVNRSVKVE